MSSSAPSGNLSISWYMKIIVYHDIGSLSDGTELLMHWVRPVGKLSWWLGWNLNCFAESNVIENRNSLLPLLRNYMIWIFICINEMKATLGCFRHIMHHSINAELHTTLASPARSSHFPGWVALRIPCKYCIYYFRKSIFRSRMKGHNILRNSAVSN